MKSGYARISTEEQNPALQLDALEEVRLQNRVQGRSHGQFPRSPRVVYSKGAFPGPGNEARLPRVYRGSGSRISGEF